MSRQENVAEKYIEKISTHKDFQNPIEKTIGEFKGAFSVLKEETKEGTDKKKEISKTQEAIKLFLLDNGLFAPFKKFLKPQLLLISKDGQSNIDDVKQIINNTDTEEEAITWINEKLKAKGIGEIELKSDKPEINPEETTETISTNVEQYSWWKLLMIEKISTNKDLFTNKTVEISKNLDINPNRLMWIMNKESGLNHQAKNKASWATGLIQFMPQTAKWLWTTTKKLKKMTNIEQLDYVEKYYSRYKGKITSHEDLYLATFYPYAMDKPQDYVVWSEQSNRRANIIWRQNPWMNNWKPITVAHIKAWVWKWVPWDYVAQFNGVEIKNNIEKYNIKETLVLWDSHVWWLKMGNYSWDTKHFNWYDTGQLYKELIKWNVNLDWKKAVILYSWSNDISKQTVRKMENNLEKIYEDLQTKWINLILSTLPENRSKGKKIVKVNNIITNFAKNKWLKIIDTNSQISIAQNEYATDGVHFNSDWYKKISQEFERNFV